MDNRKLNEPNERLIMSSTEERKKRPNKTVLVIETEGKISKSDNYFK